MSKFSIILILFNLFRKIMISLKNNRKILILVKVFETISTLVKIFGKSRFGSKFSENLNFGQNFLNFYFGQNSWNSRFIFKKSWFCPNISNYRILWKLLYIISILSKLSKILILDKIHKTRDSSQKVQKCWFWSIFSENIDCRQILLTILTSVEIIKKS